jgi:hypothetical protein
MQYLEHINKEAIENLFCLLFEVAVVVDVEQRKFDKHF